ncbi:MAG TPA: thiamine pyrophosphate-dependent enzyme, partial [Burkholderiaceae bacterium]|nr:thiamine pyrophosphate-dependent enzyme [Burkholderiaceae bacterium]
PAARRYIVEQGLNELIAAGTGDVGLVVQGGIYNSLLAALAIAGLAADDGTPRLPVLVLNATYPLVPEQIASFCAGKRAVLVLEEGHPEFIEFELATLLARAGSTCAVRGKAAFANAGEYAAEAIVPGLLRFAAEFLPESVSTAGGAAWRTEIEQVRRRAAELLAAPVPPRPPGFCIGCPERPVFAAIKLVEGDLGPRHVASDIGCHSFAMFEPFHIGNTITGYGMGLASAAGVGPLAAKRALATVGDGGFWHNGFLSGVTSAIKNGSDAVLLIFKNGYTSATGTQELVSTPAAAGRDDAGGRSTTDGDVTIESVLQGVGVKWMRSVNSYDVSAMKTTLADAFTTAEGGLKVVVADGECQLERQRRLRPFLARQQAAGERVERVRYGIDADICSGDQACVRLSGCPALTLRAPVHPLREDPITTIGPDCVGCGLCGENAQAAALCPSFYRVEVVTRPGRWERFMAGVRARALRVLLPQ